MVVSPSATTDVQNLKIAMGDFRPSGDHFSSFNIYWDTSFAAMSFEFCRVKFVQNQNYADSNWGNKINGSRCSGKIKWCTAMDLVTGDFTDSQDDFFWKKNNRDIDVNYREYLNSTNSSIRILNNQIHWDKHLQATEILRTPN
jgi:hypothetical protein